MMEVRYSDICAIARIANALYVCPLFTDVVTEKEIS